MPTGIRWSAEARRSDWGSPLFLAFSKLTSSWQTRIWANAANDNFRIAVRDDGMRTYSFAVEWNQAYRVIGFFGDGDALQSYVDGFPVAQMSQLGPYRIREEVPVSADEDTMFQDPQDPLIP